MAFQLSQFIDLLKEYNLYLKKSIEGTIYYFLAKRLTLTKRIGKYFVSKSCFVSLKDKLITAIKTSEKNKLTQCSFIRGLQFLYCSISLMNFYDLLRNYFFFIYFLAINGSLLQKCKQTWKAEERIRYFIILYLTALMY